MILKEDTDTRPYHRQCLQVLKALTTQDPSEYREIQKQITLRRRQAASHDQRHIASQKQRTRQREIQLLLELEDEYLVSLAIECCKHFEIPPEERRRQEGFQSVYSTQWRVIPNTHLPIPAVVGFRAVWFFVSA